MDVSGSELRGPEVDTERPEMSGRKHLYSSHLYASGNIRSRCFFRTFSGLFPDISGHFRILRLLCMVHCSSTWHSMHHTHRGVPARTVHLWPMVVSAAVRKIVRVSVTCFFFGIEALVHYNIGECHHACTRCHNHACTGWSSPRVLILGASTRLHWVAVWLHGSALCACELLFLSITTS